MGITSSSHIKSILTRNRNDIAFLVGNGINLYYGESASSWDDLLLDLWGRHSFNTRSTIPKGISFTEFYDALEIQHFHDKAFGSRLQKDVQHHIRKWPTNFRQKGILGSMAKFGAPVLTTNFDDQIPRSMSLQPFRVKDSTFTDFYPWSTYFGLSQFRSPLDGFGVWYINGMAKYHRSIKLGLSQYMGNVSHARKMLLNRSGEKGLFSSKSWKGHSTWLNAFFNKSLFVFGLSLDENEVFLRWLLIQRAKYIRRHALEQRKAWFITRSGGNIETDEGKIFFLESVGFEVLVVDDYRIMYEDVWS